MSAITDLAERIGTIDLSDQLVQTVQQRLFDTLAAFAAGAVAEESAILRQQFAVRGDLDDAIAYACATTRSTEVDDIYIPCCATEGSIVVPTALLAGAASGASDACVLRGLVAGYEAMSALGRAIDGAVVIYAGVWTTYFCAPFGAAAVGALVLGLDPAVTSNALGIAASRCVGTPGQMLGPASSRSYTAGRAAVDGYRAAEAAAAGLLGDTAILERALERSARVTFDAGAFASPDGRWAIQDVDTKPYRTGRQTLAATEAYLRLAPDVERIQSVTVHVPRQLKSVVDGASGMRQGIQYTLAALSADPDQVWRIGRLRAPADADALIARIHVEEDERLSAPYPWQWGSRVEIAYADGNVAAAEVLDPSGSARKPFGWPELVEKHRRLGRSPDWLARLERLCRAFGTSDHQHTCPELIKLLPVLGEHYAP